MKSYNFHNLVQINIQPGVNPSILDTVAFQIGHFASAPENGATYTINILPYADLHIPEDKILDIYYNVKGLQSHLVIDETNLLAVGTHDRGYNIWAQDNNFLITQLIQMLLLNEGIAFIHAGAIADIHGNAILLAGAGGIGKTGLIGRLVQAHNFKLLGDDIVAFGVNGNCLSFPRPFIIKDYHASVYPDIYRRYKKSRGGEIWSAIKTFVRLNAPFEMSCVECSLSVG
jgi:hypothetical protein